MSIYWSIIIINKTFGKNRMGFTYRTITANCGNNDFGAQATSIFCRHLKNSGCDFYILNLQEAEYSNILRQLNEMLPSIIGRNYQAILTTSMNTLTKPSFNNSGIASMIIYDADTLDIATVNTQTCRRNLTDGFNKGGVKASIHISKKHAPHEQIKILCLSGHLDSNRPDKRAQDWKNLLKLSSTNAETWDTLALTLPHLITAGIDCNTRDLLDQEDSPIWLTHHEEVQGFNQFPIGNLRYSSKNTYRPKSSDLSEKASKYQQQGYVLSGSLDVNEILSTNLVDYACFDTEYSQVIPTVEEHSRDHLIILSPILNAHALDDFENVRNHLYLRLNKVAPTLATEIMNLENIPENKERLRYIYQNFFQDNGLMEQLINLYQLKLCLYREIKNSNRSPIVIDQIQQQFFHNTPWLDTLCLANFSEHIHAICRFIENEDDILRTPKDLKTFEELKQECINILSQYTKMKTGTHYFLSNPSTVLKKSKEIETTINGIEACESKQQISDNLESLRLLSQSKTGKLVELIDDCRRLIDRSDTLYFENPLRDLKKYVIYKFDHYQILPKDNPTKNASKIKEKDTHCHNIISNVHHASSIDEIFLILNDFHERQKMLLNGSGKFASTFNQCFEQTKKTWIRSQELDNSRTFTINRK